jgi:hypothetical protein
MPGESRAKPSRFRSPSGASGSDSKGSFLANEHKEFEMAHTLNEFIAFTKGCEYLVILGYLLIFISFWRFLTYRDK